MGDFSQLLPNELWRTIVRFATLAPDPMGSWDNDIETSDQDIVTFGWPFMPSLSKRYFQSLKTKRALALVDCRFWRISCEFLYESLFLRNAVHVTNLADGMDLRASQFEGGLSTWTRQILVSPSITYTDLIQPFAESAITILNHCPAVRSILIKGDPSWVAGGDTFNWSMHGRRILRAIPPVVLHLHVECTSAGAGGWQPEFLLHNSAAPSLRSLRITGNISRDEDFQAYAFPSLTHLSLERHKRNDVRLLCGWGIENLTHLYINRLSDDGASNPFWKMQKPSLLHLHMGAETASLTATFAQLILQGVPNLRVLEYFYIARWVEGVWDQTCIPKSIVHVCVKTYSPLDNDGVLGYKSRDRSRGLKSRTEMENFVNEWVALARHMAPIVSPPVSIPLTLCVPTHRSINLKVLHEDAKIIFSKICPGSVIHLIQI